MRQMTPNYVKTFARRKEHLFPTCVFLADFLQFLFKHNMHENVNTKLFGWRLFKSQV